MAAHGRRLRPTPVRIQPGSRPPPLRPTQSPALVDQLVGEDIALEAAAATILPVEEAIAGATSLQDLRTRLDRIAQAPPPDALAQLYARADFIAGMAGNAGVPLADEEEPQT